MRHEVKIIDLDGTLCRRNTFVRYVKWCAGQFMRHGNMRALLRLAGIVTLRKIRAISHREAKWRIMAVTLPHFPKTKMERFADTLMPEIRNGILSGEEAETILATAAPYEYASILAEKLHIGCCIATIFTETPEEYLEIRSGAKASAVREKLEHNRLTDTNKYLLTLYTDINRRTGEAEDAPLAEYVKSIGGKITLF